MVRIRSVEPLPGYRLRLGLTDGRTIERNLTGNLWGVVFHPLRDPAFFAQARVEYGTVVWPNGVDLDPDVLIWGETGAPREERE
jgi:hypothetical protein